MRNAIKEFKEFIAHGNLVDLAVAVVIGAAFAALIKALVEDLITPVIAAIFGQPDFSGLKFTINSSTGVLSFVSAPNFEAPSDAGANNVYDVTVQVSDDGSPALTDSKTFSVVVNEVNSPPTLTVRLHPSLGGLDVDDEPPLPEAEVAARDAERLTNHRVRAVGTDDPAGTDLTCLAVAPQQIGRAHV